MDERKDLAHVIVEEGKGPKGWQLTFLEENFKEWIIHAFSRNLSSIDQKHVASMFTEGENLVLISGGFKLLKNNLMKNNVTIYDLDLLDL